MANAREAPAGRSEESTGRSIEVKTLVIAAIAAVVAAVVTSAFWQRGALISTALTPVIVALVQELLRRPAERISSTASRVKTVPVRGGALAGVGARRDPAAERFEPRRLAERDGGDAPGGPGPPASNGAGATRRPTTNGAGPQPAPRPKVYKAKRFRPRVVIATAAAAFLLAAGALTVSELVFGGPVAADGKTTLFGGGDGGGESSDEATTDPSQSEDPEAAAPSDSAESQAAPEDDSAVEEPAPAEPAPEEPAPEEPVEPVEPAE